MQLSVIVICLNEEKHLPRCLSAIRDQGSDLLDIDLIVVDGGSTDRSKAIASDHGARVIDSPKGIPKQRNAGGREAQAPVMAFVDADVELLPGWGACVRKHFAEHDSLVLGSAPQLPPDASWVAEAYALHWGVEPEAQTDFRAARLLSTQSLALHTEIFHKVGGFREDIGVEEDHVFVVDAEKTGAHLIADPALAYIHHGEPRSLQEFFQRQLWGANSDLWWQHLREGDFEQAWRPRYVYGAVMAGETAALALSALNPFGGWQIGVPLSLAALSATVGLPALRTAQKNSAYDKVGQLALMYGAYGMSTAMALAGLGKNKQRRWR